MFLCRGRRSIVPSSFSFCNLAGSVQVAANTPQDAIWSLHNFSIISGCQVRARGAMIQGEPGNTNMYKYPAWTAYESVSRFGFILPFSWRSKDGFTNIRQNSPKSFFCLGPQTCIIRSSASPNAPKQHEADWTKGEAAAQVNKVTA